MANFTDELKTLENEFKSAIKRNDEAASERLNDKIADVEAKMKAIELAAARPATEGDKDAEFKAAFTQYMRDGDKAKLIEKKAAVMSAGVPAEGGFTVPKVIADTIQRQLVDISPLRQIANVVSVSTTDYHIPFGAGVNSVWVGEKDTRPATDAPALVDIVPPMGELYAAPAVTQQIIEDSQFDIVSYVQKSLAIEFGRAEGAAFIAGNGVNKPSGILNAPQAATADASRPFGTLQSVTTSTAGAVTAQDLIGLTFAIKAGYRQNAAWVLNKATLGAIRGLTDNTGQFLWQTSYQAGTPSLLLGYPIYEAEDMPNVGTGNVAAIFGDFNRGYTIVDRIGMQMLVDNLTLYPYTAYKTRKRVGGTVVDSQALKVLKIK